MTKPVLYIVDDEQDFCELMAQTFNSEKFDIKTYNNPSDFLKEFDGSKGGCLLLDNRMPLITGMQILEKIRHWLPIFPVFLVTGYADVTMAVHAMQIGAYGLIQKPVTKESILDQVEAAIEKSMGLRQKYKEASDVWLAMQELTQREVEILDLLLAGQSSKDIAENLKISRFTVDHHRAHIMDKLKSPSLSGLTSAVATAKALFEKPNSLLDSLDRKS